MRRFIMAQCLNSLELDMNDTTSHVDGFDLKKWLSSEEVHERALAARRLYGKAEKSLTFCTNAKISTIPKWCLFCALVMLH